MRLILVISTAFLCGLVAAVDNSNSKDGTMFIDPSIDVMTIKPNKKTSSRDSESSGDDEDGSGDVQGDASGDGSGAVAVTPTTESQTLAPTTKEENVVVRKVVTAKRKPSTKATTEPEAVTSSEKPDIVITEEIETESTQPPVYTTEIPTTEDDMFAGGIGDGGDPNVAARKQEKEGLRVLTKEVIAAVIVGGICAIILIAFLVYRLRKRDEGSYVLTDSAYKDTNKLRGDTGKEAFV